MSDRAYVGYVTPKGVIKTVSVETQGSMEYLGVELNENFKCIEEVKKLVKSSISFVEDGEVVYTDNLEELTTYDYEFLEYDDRDEYFEDMEPNIHYYLFENDTWYVSKPNADNLLELETVLEEEYY